MEDDSSLHDSPTEFMHAIANSGGTCDAQSVIPADGHYACSCSCGSWSTTADSREEGLALARQHTSTVSV